MSLQSDVRAVMKRSQTYLADDVEYRTKTNGVWSAWATCRAEIKTIVSGEEFDDARSLTIKKQRAVVKIFDTATANAPTLRLGDELRADSLVWAVSEIMLSERAAGVYRYQVVRDVTLRAQPQRNQTPVAEGGDTVPT
jgi:hypothetical protein